MTKAVWMITFKLKKGVTQDEFIDATQKVHDMVVSQQKGFISWSQFLDGDVWTDFVTWETMEDANKALTAGSGNPVARSFYALINMNSCKAKVIPVIKEY